MPTRETIIKNRAYCKKCSIEVESKSVHDFRSCKCGSLSVDGGRDYLHRLGDPNTYIDTSIVTDATPIWTNVGKLNDSDR